ncbi:MAG: hypothetical protein Q8K82_20220 [Gemmatimonadaceae bacterium]|nr:hypothetical protein [Gemmatimonadaceae bacterium]
MQHSSAYASFEMALPIQEVRDAARTEVQNQVRDAVRDALRGTRDGLTQGAGGGPAPARGVVAPQAVIDALNAQIAGERATIDQLTKQLLSGTTEPREAVLTSQIEASQERLSSLQVQLDQALGVRVTSGEVPPDAPFRPTDDMPQGAVDVTLAFFFTVAVIAIGLPLARAFARRMDRKGQIAVATAAPSNTDPRLERIEQAIEAIAIEVERVSEGQRFANRLMGEIRALPAPNPLEQWPRVAQKEAVPVVDHG